MPLVGVGWNRPPAAGCAEVGADQAEPEPFVGQPRQFSPEQDCLDVGRNRARAHCAWAHRNLCEVLWRRLDLSIVWPGRFLIRGQERDGYLCSKWETYPPELVARCCRGST